MPTNPFTIDPRDYKYGARGDQIVALQEALVFAGYEVSADGIFGDETRRALERFEIDHSYNDTLSLAVDQRTLTMLFNQVGVDFGPTPPTEPEPEPPDPEPDANLDRGRRDVIGEHHVQTSWAEVLARGNH